MRLLRYCCGTGGDSSDRTANSHCQDSSCTGQYPSSHTAISRQLGREEKGKRQPGEGTGSAELFLSSV